MIKALILFAIIAVFLISLHLFSDEFRYYSLLRKSKKHVGSEGEESSTDGLDGDQFSGEIGGHSDSGGHGGD